MIVGTISLEDVRRRYPDSVGVAIAALGKSRSKERESPVESLTWTFESCVSIEGPEPQDLESKIADRVRRTGTCLVARKGRWRFQVLIDNPPEVEAWHRSVVTKQFRDQEEWDTKPTEEKERAMQEILRGLFGPGFIALGVRFCDSKRKAKK